MVWQEYSWGTLANSWERLANRTEKLENRMDWMENKMDWLGSMLGKWVNNWGMLESRDLLENMREKLGNMLDSMLRRFATESNVVKLESSWERLVSNLVTSD